MQQHLGVRDARKKLTNRPVITANGVRLVADDPVQPKPVRCIKGALQKLPGNREANVAQVCSRCEAGMAQLVDVERPLRPHMRMRRLFVGNHRSVLLS